MNISAVFIKKPIMTTLVMITLVAFGIAAYLQLPIGSLPSVKYPVITITASYPGASPSRMASAIAAPIERECMDIPGLNMIISDNRNGVSTLTLAFDLDRDVDMLAPDVQAALTRATGDLPSDLPHPPTYEKTNPAETPIMYIMVTSATLTDGDLYEYADREIRTQLTTINGVSQVGMWGAKAAIRVKLNPQRLAALDIAIDEVDAALQRASVTLPGGTLDGPYRAYSIMPDSQLTTSEEYANLIIAYRDNAPVRLGDVARCVKTVDNEQVRVMFGAAGGAPAQSGAICIFVKKASGANTVALADTIHARLAAMRETLPGAIDMNILYDGSLPIRESVRDVQTTVVLALILVVLVIFLFLGRVRETVIPSTVLPLAIVGTCVLMAVFGFSLNNLSLMAITLSVGFLVDDAIVVLENTVRHIEEGKTPFAAALQSMTEITGTVISTSIALIIVFVPLLFMEGVIGRNFREFALTVVFAISVSTLLALTLTPMMCARVLTPAGSSRTYIQNLITKIIDRISATYGVILSVFLRRKFLAIILWIVCISGTIALFAVLPKAFMPTGDSGLIVGMLQADLGTSSAQIAQTQDELNALLRTHPAVTHYLTVTGDGSGPDLSHGIFVVTLKPRNVRADIEQITAELNAMCYSIPGALVYMEPIPAMQLTAGAEATASGAHYSYTLHGQYQNEVYEAVEKLAAEMAQIPGITGIQVDPKLIAPQVDVYVLHDRAAALGVTMFDSVFALLRSFAAGKSTTYLTDTDQYDVILELEDDFRAAPENLSTLYIRSRTTGELVPLTSLVETDVSLGPMSVPHMNQLSSATISFNTAAGTALGDVTKRIHAVAQNILPPTVHGALQGEASEFEDAIKSLTFLLLVAVFLMYVILGILYENYSHPFTVLTTLPVAAFGGLLTLLFFGQELSIYAYIGMFMLIGIVSKNGIMMVDFATQYMRDEHVDAVTAIHKACLVRFRPILMTGVSTIAGAIPIALGYGADGSSRISLGLIIVGGLAFAQVITLFVTPGIFLYMNTFQERVLDRFAFTRSEAARYAHETH